MPGPVIFGASGNPEPSPEIQRRLQAIHPRLFIEFMAVTGSHWGVYLKWAQGDARWEKVQKGFISEDKARDRIGNLPLDCGAEEAPGYLSKMFREYPREDVRNMADAILQYNMTAPVAQAAEEAMAEVMDMPDPSQTKSKRKRSK